MGGDRKTHNCSRLAWTFYFGEIPKGLHVLHACDVRACINPHHLFLGTASRNSIDAFQKGRKFVMKPGEAAVGSKLKDKDIPVIRASSLSSPKLAKIYGVKKETIRAVILRKTWKHI